MELIKQPFQLNLDNTPEIKSAYAIAQSLNEAGYQAVIAGGAVRDLLLGKTPKDYDIATSAPPEKVLKLFRKTQKVGIAFGVVLVRDFGIATEVATFRTDGEYSDGRRPDKVTFTDAASDAQRRDFSINGMFYDFEEKCILDYVGGLADLKKEIIRAIRDPHERFKEDYLRMIRAIRFSLTLNFKIEENTFNALKLRSPNIVDIAPDRIHVELKKCFSQKISHHTIKILNETGLLQYLFKKADPSSYHLNDHPFNAGGDFTASLCLLNSAETSASAVEAALIAMRCTNEEKRDVKKLFSFKENLLSFSSIPIYEQKRTIRQCDTNRLLFLALNFGAAQNEIDALEHHIKIWKQVDLFSPLMPSGKELIAAGLKSDASMGKYMIELENELLEGNLRTKEDVFQHLESHISKNQA